MIAAVSKNGVIGKENSLPFYYPEDLKHFKKLTSNSIVIMGRKTFESIGKPLPNRRNIVISKIAKSLQILNNDSIEIFSSIEQAIEELCPPIPLVGTTDPNYDPYPNIWFIGGAQIYQQALPRVQEIHLTITPDFIDGKDVVRFPWIDPTQFEVKSMVSFIENNNLTYVIYRKI